MEPLPEHPTNGDLAKGLVKVHDCVEEVRELAQRAYEQGRVLYRRQDRLMVAFGLEEPHDGEAEEDAVIKPRRGKPVALMSQGEAAWKGLVTIGGALGGLFIMAKLLAAALPGLEVILHGMAKVVLG